MRKCWTLRAAGNCLDYDYNKLYSVWSVFSYAQFRGYWRHARKFDRSHCRHSRHLKCKNYVKNKNQSEYTSQTHTFHNVIAHIKDIIHVYIYSVLCNFKFYAYIQLIKKSIIFNYKLMISSRADLIGKIGVLQFRVHLSLKYTYRGEYSCGLQQTNQPRSEVEDYGNCTNFHLEVCRVSLKTN